MSPEDQRIETMADISTHTAYSDAPARGWTQTIISAPMAALRSVGRFFVLLAETNSRVKAIEHLNTLSDAQLAERGIKKREDIARHVFRDLFYV